MNPRVSLAIAAVIIVGGMVALWLRDGAAIAPVAPVSSEQPQAEEPPPQDYVLAISWHAAFCETKPNLTECRRQQASDYTATHFALHGLWPQDDEYCGVGQEIIDIDEANRWDRLPPIDVTDATWRALVRLMPGTTEQLERHEWALHGSCAGVSAERYYSRAIGFVEELNRSKIRDLFADNLGKRIASTQIRSAIDGTFGTGAGRKVRVDCEDDGERELVYELRINLYGDVMGQAGLADLIHDGRNISAGCPGGIIDRVGTQ